MEKRWLQFFIVVVIAYGGLIWFTQPMREAESEADSAEVASTNGVDSSESSISDAPDTGDSSPDSSETTEENVDSQPSESEAQPESQEPANPRFATRESAPKVTVKTDLAEITFSQLGAVPLSWEILPSEFVAPVQNLDTGTTSVINLIPQVANQTDRNIPLELEGGNFSDFNREFFDVTQRSTSDLEILEFTSGVKDGLQMTKTYTIHKDTFVTDLEIKVKNGDQRNIVGTGRRGWGIGWQGGFLQPEVPKSRAQGYIYGIVAAGDDTYLKDVELGDDPREYENNVAWAGQEKKYFAAVVIPHPDNPATAGEITAAVRDASDEYKADSSIPDPMSVLLYHDPFELSANEEKVLKFAIFAGPKDLKLLTNADVAMIPSAPGLDRVAFASMPLGQGWVRPISIGLITSLRWFEGFAKNWGLAIILLVLTVKIILYPLSHWAIKNQAKTMAEQTKIKPFLEEINKKYKDDAQKRAQETMKLYRDHNINPLGALRGCFPILLQTPIFIGLYVALDQAVELRGQSFLWIDNLAAPDRLLPLGFAIPLLGWDALNILPILMAGTQFITTRMMSSNITDPTQKQIMTLMPIFFTFILYSMPAGLMLYWTVQNVWQIGHTYLTKKHVAAHDTSPPENKQESKSKSNKPATA